MKFKSIGQILQHERLYVGILCRLLLKKKKKNEKYVMFQNHSLTDR